MKAIVNRKTMVAYVINLTEGDEIINEKAKIVVVDRFEECLGDIMVIGVQKGNRKPSQYKCYQRCDDMPLMIFVGQLHPDLGVYNNQHIEVKQQGVNDQGKDTDNPELITIKYKYLAVKCSLGHWHQDLELI